jgi:hypothetical protein
MSDTNLFDQLVAAFGKAYAQLVFKAKATEGFGAYWLRGGGVFDCAEDAVDGLMDAIITAAAFDPKRFKAAVEESRCAWAVTLQPAWDKQYEDDEPGTVRRDGQEPIYEEWRQAGHVHHYRGGWYWHHQAVHAEALRLDACLERRTLECELEKIRADAKY